jgi:hypothetical protein
MPSALFEFFELVAGELSTAESMVITPDNLNSKNRESSLLDDLKKEMQVNRTEEAIKLAVVELERHFKSKGADLPFLYTPDIGMFTVTDSDFLAFVRRMSSIRSEPKRSRDFECTVAERLFQRATGSIHRVGHPRDKKKTKKAFNTYLKTLGFTRTVLFDKEKDGGLDILWLLPIGSVNYRPIVAVQCKNGFFNIEEADKSTGSSSRSLSQHGGLQGQVHVPCVLFNDYIYPKILPRKGLNFVPLGLTDLTQLKQKISLDLI